MVCKKITPYCISFSPSPSPRTHKHCTYFIFHQSTHFLLPLLTTPTPIIFKCPHTHTHTRTISTCKLSCTIVCTFFT
eukprot:UN10842